jgi:hypothetical protein
MLPFFIANLYWRYNHMSTTQFIKNPFTSRFCEQMNVPGTHDRQVAAYLIGTPNPASITNPGFMAVCKSCAKSIVEKLPDELLKHVNVERAFSLMGEEQREILFDKLFPPAEPEEILDSLLGTVGDYDKLEAILAKRGFAPFQRQPEPEPDGEPLDSGDGFPVQAQKEVSQAVKTLNEEVYQYPCPHCIFIAKNQAGLSSHIKAKHPGNEQ